MDVDVEARLQATKAPARANKDLHLLNVDAVKHVCKGKAQVELRVLVKVVGVARKRHLYAEDWFEFAARTEGWW